MIYRLSHSALDLLNLCERKFQLDRLLSGAPDKQEWPTTAFGKSLGIAVASYLSDQNRDKAIVELWLAYPEGIEDDRRNVWTAINMLQNIFPKLDTLLLDWEPAIIRDRTTAELSFRLNIDENFYYVGYIDFILKNRFTSKYGVVEIKTTALQLLDLDPVYKNSGQAVGYSIVLDKIAGEEQAEYDVIYIIGQIGGKMGFDPTIHIKTFHKTLQDRLNWFLTIGVDVDRLTKLLALNFFPQRGQSCLKWNKACIHFGTCGLHSLDRPKIQEVDTIDYMYVYDINEIIESHIARINGL